METTEQKQTATDIISQSFNGKDLLELYISLVKKARTGTEIDEASRAFIQYAPNIILGMRVEDPYRKRLTEVTSTLLYGGLEALTEFRTCFPQHGFRDLRERYFSEDTTENPPTIRDVVKEVRGLLPDELLSNRDIRRVLIHTTAKGYVLNPWNFGPNLF